MIRSSDIVIESLFNWLKKVPTIITVEVLNRCACRYIRYCRPSFDEDEKKGINVNINSKYFNNIPFVQERNGIQLFCLSSPSSSLCLNIAVVNICGSKKYFVVIIPRR